MLTSKHLVICLYIIEICCVCVILFSSEVLERKKNDKVSRMLSGFLLIRLIVKMIYFYIEYYIHTWPLNLTINAAMDATYVITVMLCISLVKEMTGIQFRGQKFWSVFSSISFVLGFSVISFFWVDPASNVMILIRGLIPQILYGANEILFLTVMMTLCIRYLFHLKEVEREKRVYCRWLIFNNMWYCVYVFCWNISFVIPNGERLRALKPLDGVLPYVMVLIFLYGYSFHRKYFANVNVSENAIRTENVEENAVGVKEVLPKKMEKSADEGQVSEAESEELIRIEQHLRLLAEERNLTKRETEILQLLYNGESYSEISEELMISINTVKRHCSHIYLKCDIKSRNQITTLLN